MGQAEDNFSTRYWNGSIKIFLMLLAANLRNYSFLARLLIKQGGLLQLNSGGCGVNMHTCGRDNLKSFSCVLPKFVMLVTRVTRQVQYYD